MLDFLFKGILIGLIFGLPVGAVGAMTVQRTLAHGLKAGLLTGLGSSVADCIYAVIGAFGLTLISNLLLKYQTAIQVLGGIFLLLMGVRLFLKQTQTVSSNENVTGGIKLFLSSFVIGITNPVAILTFLFAFSYFGITGVAELQEGVALVCGVFLGTYLWWSAISFVAYKVKKKQSHHSFPSSNKVFGTILTLFGVIVLIKFFEALLPFSLKS